MYFHQAYAIVSIFSMSPTKFNQFSSTICHRFYFYLVYNHLNGLFQIKLSDTLNMAAPMNIIDKYLEKTFSITMKEFQLKAPAALVREQDILLSTRLGGGFMSWPCVCHGSVHLSFILNIFFSETTCWILTKHHRNDSGMALFRNSLKNLIPIKTLVALAT